MQLSLRHRHDYPELQRWIQRERSAKQRDRCRMVGWALEGHNAAWIAAKLDRSDRFVQKWAYAYRGGGPDAIAAVPQPGTPTKLSSDEERAFTQRLDVGPNNADGGVCTLQCKDVVRILDQHFGVSNSLRDAYDLLPDWAIHVSSPGPSNPSPSGETVLARRGPQAVIEMPIDGEMVRYSVPYGFEAAKTRFKIERCCFNTTPCDIVLSPRSV